MDNKCNASMPATGAPSRRQHIMKLCAHADEVALETALSELAPLPDVVTIRPPETGLVMLTGRIGGDGQNFNMGEASVTRAVVRLQSGEVGFSYVLGRSHRKAAMSAIIDALGQCPTWTSRLQDAFIAPVEAHIAAEQTVQRAQTEATKVAFFTLVRGDP